MTDTPNAAAQDTPGQPAADWDELVAAALLGTDRRTPPVAPRPGQEAATALLEAAALHTVQHRAGLRPAAARPRPAPAPDDPRPDLPAAARVRLAMLLTERAGTGGGGSRTAPDLAELLPQWLSAANGHGYRAPSALLPALLDAARARTDLRPAALALAGPHALWLARLNPDWKFALRGGPAGGAGASDAAASDAALDAAATRQIWEEGLFAERVALLAALRRQDPAAARELIAGTWAAERAEDRLMFLDSLREGLTPADEPFVEQALSDRSRNVRSTAAELLSALPDSALAARMAVRSLACVTLRESADGGRAEVVVEPPGECDSEMQRDGVVAKPPSGRGERSWWLGQLVEATPLDAWLRQFAGRTPADVLALPVADDWQAELHAAWGRAAVRQRNADWARALLRAPGDDATPATDPTAQAAADQGATGQGLAGQGPTGQGPTGQGAAPGRGSGAGQAPTAATLATPAALAMPAMPAASTAHTTQTTPNGPTTPTARAALGGPPPASPNGPSWRDPAKLLTVLPAAERAEWVAAFIAAHGLSDAFRLLGVCTVPWAEPLGRAVVDALDIARDAGSYPWSFSGVMGLAERCLDPALADRLEVLTAQAEEPRDSAPGASGYWSEAFQRLVGTLRLRATMQAELAPAPPQATPTDRAPPAEPA
ncbi:DUF5691 domain-containing protein [Streptomyces sp. HSW2009]|uniref:DUF5691 domain-containing protein n=1 Tax=Streptomyces sp. HSW2009 TaxID=3142890 RepID=UPI0032EDF236